MRLPWVLCVLALVPLVAAAEAPRPKPVPVAAAPLTQREQALQMLNRFSFGPRPGEVDQVLAAGAQAWFERQLKPQAITDGVLANRLKEYPTLTMTPAQVLLTFPDRNTVAQIADGKRPPPNDPLLAHLYSVLVYKYKAEQSSKDHPAPELTEAEKTAEKQADQATAARIASQLFALPRQSRMDALNVLPPADRIAFATSLDGPQRNLLQADFNPREREALQAMQYGINSAYRAQDELAQARLLRDVLSERELEQVMTDFWFNHFNVFMPKDSDQWYTTAFERDAIRPHALGRFRDLLLATAQSPAMLVYLDNWLSIGPDSEANGVNPAKPNSKPGRKGLNENYGREVMELHTLGVNGGYTQADVTALAAVLTGWTVDKPGQGGPFQFDPKKHEPGTKQWFGYTLGDDGAILSGPKPAPAVAQAIASSQAAVDSKQPGMKQGLTALILLAASPRTAHFISYQLAQSFLADNPPPAVVDRMTAAYLSSDGDISTVLRALVQSPEFNSRRYFRSKVKLPEEFVASAFRATATDPQNPGALVTLLANQFGEPLYKALPPTGYYITADHWMNTQSLMGRLNFADQLTHNKFANQKFDSSRVLALSLLSDHGDASPGRASQPVAYTQSAGSDVALRVLEKSLIGGELSASTADFIQTQLAEQPASDPAAALNLITALLLGSPEFQVR